MNKLFIVISAVVFILTGCATSSVGIPSSSGSYPGINKNDVFTRQFTYDEADLIPIVGSTRPSAVILLNKGVNAAKSNQALCRGFTSLATAEDLEASGTAVTQQVVTKLPVKLPISQNTNDCNLILSSYDYDLAKKKLVELNPSLASSSGPFVAVINPNSSKIDQLIDLRGVSEEKLEAFGKDWYSIFTQVAVTAKAEEQKTGKRTTLDFMMSLKKFFQSTVCVTDPNLIYIFNENAGKIADAIVCKSQKT